MKKLVISILTSAALVIGQTVIPGVIVESQTKRLQITAGNLSAIIEVVTPIPAAGQVVHVDCWVGTGKIYTGDNFVSNGNVGAVGFCGEVSAAGATINGINWVIQMATSPIAGMTWQVAANGTVKKGVWQ